MKPWHRTTLRIAGSLVVLGIIALIAARVLVDPEKLKALAVAKAKANWSRELTIGDLDMGFFPLPWVEAANVDFANPGWAAERRFFHADRITADLALWPLLEGNVKLKSVSVKGGRAVLEVSKDGHGTWDLANADAVKKPESPATRRNNLLELRRLRFEDFAIVDKRKPDKPHVWHIQEASLAMVPVLRDVRLELDATRDGRPLKAKVKLDDFSHFGERGATTEGRIDLDWGGAKLTLAGHVPLEPSLEGERLHGDLVAPALGDMLGFFGYKRQPRAPIEAHFDVTGSKDDIHLDKVAATMGGLRANGSMQIRTGGPKAIYDLRLTADNVDWTKALADAGGNVHKGVPPGEILPDTPMGWGILEALKNKKGSLEAQVGSVKLGNGLELRNVKTKMSFEDDRLDVTSFTTQMLGGSASFKVRAEGHSKRGHLELDGHDLLLERWFKERGKKIPFEGGPMQIKATLDSNGASMKELAANMSGPVSIHMGRGLYRSERAEAAEAKLSSASNDPAGIRFECVGASLPFKAGRAARSDMVGAASDTSRLVTSGVIDFRGQTIDLHGRLKPKSGVGLATVAGDLKIFGAMAKPHMAIDKPAVLARFGAAIASVGLSAAATAVADASADNPCEAVFERR